MNNIPVWAFYIAAAVVGLELGSVATIFIQRWIDEVPILKPGASRCPSCQSTLRWCETIPLVSYFLNKGKCQHCGEAIGAQYLLVEISCLTWSLAMAHHFGPSVSWVVYLVLGVMLVAGSFIDFETMMLPNRITIGGSVLALAAAFLLPQPGWQQAVFGSLLGGGFFWLLQQGYRLWRKEEGLGSGDVKLMFMIGAIVGVNGLPFTIIIATATSAVGIGYFMLKSSSNGLQTRIPFGPFLALGCMACVLFGDLFTQWWRLM